MNKIELRLASLQMALQSDVPAADKVSIAGQYFDYLMKDVPVEQPVEQPQAA